jgi:ComF family protein
VQFTSEGGELFTEICPGCGDYTVTGFCAVCAAGFRRVADPCANCGLARPVARCPRRAHAWHIGTVAAPLLFCAPLDHYVHALKYHRVRKLDRALALLLLAALPSPPTGIDALVPVPLQPRRLRERGYNQATEIARTLGHELRLPLLQRGVERRGEVRSQIGRTASERRASVAGAFAARCDLRGLHLAIVDDVLTTGATVNALAAALLNAGAEACSVWAVARTPDA